jgi:hypothetical protein
MAVTDRKDNCTLRDLLCGADLNEFNARRGRRNGKPVLAKPFDVKLNGLFDEFEDFVASFCHCHTTRQVRNMCAKTGFALFDDDGVFHNVILFQTRLFENAVKCPGRYVDIWFACHGHRSTLGLMFELAVATFRSSQVPAVFFE